MKQNVKTLDLSKENMTKIAQQLSCPQGEDGVSIGENMYKSNEKMIIESILALDLEEKNRVLELGHGSCTHLKHVMQQANDLRYFGMEISNTMLNEAKRINHEFTKKNHALFQLYNGQDISYVLNFFDRILTVNTIYFWEDPIKFLNEMYRVLKPNGIFVLAFVQKGFMEKLPFVTDKIFNLYNTPKLKKIIENTGFKLLNIEDKTEPAISKSGDLVNRAYTIVKLTK